MSQNRGLPEGAVLVAMVDADVRLGLRGNLVECAIAQAVRRITGTSHASVDGYGVDVWCEKKQKEFQYVLPEEAREFIDRFDSGEEVEPIAFVMTLAAVEGL